MFTDKRSKKVLLVAHCILNQNSKLDRCAHYPGAVPELAEIFQQAGVGVIQMPCPEILLLGLDREADPGQHPTVEEEDTRIADLMAAEPMIAACRSMAKPLLFQVQEYQKHGFQIVGIVGINGSPTCGVETTWSAGCEEPGPGVFIRELKTLLEGEQLHLQMRGVKVYQPAQACLAAKELLEQTS